MLRLLCAALLPSALCASPPLQLQLLGENLARERGAQCLDHSPAGYYVREQDPTKWVIFLEGGGLCVEPIDCIMRVKSSQGSSKYLDPTKPPEAPSTTSLSALNPFNDWSHVWVPYCSGDTWLGASSRGHASLLGLQMSGHLILETILERLLNTTSLGSASEVVLSGSSAGGIGAFHHTDWLAETLTAKAEASGREPPRVVGLPIEGMFFPEKWPVLLEQFALGNTEPVANFMSQYLAVLDFQNPWFPPACVEASKKDGFSKGDCFDVSKMLFYTKTPLFIAMNRFDALLIQDLAICLTCKVNDDAHSLHGRFTRFYGAKMNETVFDVNRVLPQTGWFVPSEFHHDENFYKFLDSIEKTIDNVSFRAAFEAWYLDGEQVVLLEPLCGEDGPCVAARECNHSVAGGYTDAKWGKSVSIVQDVCELEVAYGDDTLAGGVLGDAVTVATFHSSGSLQSNGNVKFADGGIWIRSHPSSDCEDVHGYYVDSKQRKGAIVNQSECDIIVEYSGEALQGGVFGGAVTIYGFKVDGDVQDSGDIQFADGGLWTKLSDQCVDIAGEYIDGGLWHKKVTVAQAHCDLTVDYGDDKLSGSIFGPLVTIASFRASGSVQDNGDIAFADGGLWARAVAAMESAIV